jgi:hypothetical protein
MALLAAKSPAAAGATPALLYTPDAGRKATVNVLFSNRDAASGTFRLWLSASSNPASVKPEEMIEADTLLGAAGTVNNAGEKTMLTVGDGQALHFAGSSKNISFVVHGYTEAA